jgi:hypothetical protein
VTFSKENKITGMMFAKKKRKEKKNASMVHWKILLAAKGSDGM